MGNALPILAHRQSGAINYPLGLKGRYRAYVTGVTNAQLDTAPVGLGTPTNTQANYHEANHNTIDAMHLIQANRLHLRGRLNSASGDITITVIVWGIDEGSTGAVSAGQVLAKDVKLTVGTERDGDGNAGDYITPELVYDVGPFAFAHAFITATTNATVIDLDWMMD